MEGKVCNRARLVSVGSSWTREEPWRCLACVAQSFAYVQTVRMGGLVRRDTFESCEGDIGEIPYTLSSSLRRLLQPEAILR